MTSETVDPLTGRYPPPYTSAPKLHILHGVKAGYKSPDLQQQPGREHASLGMPGQRTACAATKGIGLR